MQAQGYSNSNDLMTDFAAGMIQSQGKNYLQKGQALFQSKMGFLSTGDLYYLFDIDMAYGELPPFKVLPLKSKIGRRICKLTSLNQKYIYISKCHMQK